MKRGLTLLLVFSFVFTIYGNTKNTNQPKTTNDLSKSAVSQTYLVTSTGDGGAGSLRQAIADANANPGLDIIEFAIANGAQTLTVNSQIIITDEVIIDGATQPGFASSPIITLNGSNVFRIDGGASTTEIRNLAFQANGTFSGVAIYMNANNLKIEQNTFDDYSVTLNGVVRTSLIKNNVFRDNTHAMRWDGSGNNDNTFESNDFSGSRSIALWFNSRFNNGNRIINNNFTNAGGVSSWAIRYSGVPAEINGNDFTGAGGAMNLLEANGFNLTAPGSTGPNSNTYGGHTFGVFRYDASSNITIENWDFSSLFLNPAGRIALGGTGIRNFIIQNNNFSGGFAHGIRFDSNGNNDSTYDNNNFSGSTSTALWFNGRFNNNNTITNNDFRNAGGVSSWAIRYSGVPAEINGNDFTGAGGAMNLLEANGFSLTAPGSTGPNLNTYGGHTFGVFRYDASSNITIENWDFPSLFINPSGRIALGGTGIRNFTIRNNDFSGGFSHGIRFDSNGNNDSTYDNNNFSGSTSTGLWFNGRFNNNNTITNNDFRNSGGVSAWALRYTGIPAEINGNDFTGTGGAILLNEANGFNLTAAGSTGPNSNTYGGHTFGVFRYDNSSNLIIENWTFAPLFNDPTNRIALGGSGIRTSVIRNNDFSGGFVHGMRIDSNGNNDNTLDNNNFSGSTSTGLWFNGRFNNNNTITNNDFRNAGGVSAWALRYTGIPSEINANDFTGTGGAILLNEANGFNLTAAGSTGPNSNTYGGHTFGVFRYDNSNNLIIENWTFAPLFNDPTNRIALGGSGIRTSVIRNNNFSGGFVHGIRYDGNSNNENTLDNNNFSGSTSTGLWFNGRFNNNNTITNNDFRNAGGVSAWALRYTGIPSEINANDFTGTGGAILLNEANGFSLTAPGSTGPNLNTYGGHTFGVFRYDNSNALTIENWTFAPLFNDPTNRIALGGSGIRTSTIRNNDFSGGFVHGIRYDGNSNNELTIDNNNFTGTTSDALRFTGRFNVQNTITNNDFTDAAGYGLYYIGVPTDISGNTFSGNGSGIFFSEANNFTLGVNNFESLNGTGISIQNSTGTRLENLRFIGDGGTGIYLLNSRNVVMDNIEMCGKQYGIRLVAQNVGWSDNNQILNSKIANSTIDAIRVEFFTANTTIDGTQYFGNNQDLNDLSTTTTVTNSSTASSATWCPATGPDVPFVTDFELELDENGQATLNADELYDGDAANSGITFTVSPSEFSCADLGAQDVTLTGTDANGSTEVTVSITVADNSGPNITLVDGDVTIGVGDTFVDPGTDVADNCSDNSEITITTTNDINVNEVGQYTVVYTATDASGNSSTATRNVIVADTTAPVVIVNPTFQIALDASGNATITPENIDNGSTDETSNVSLSVSPFAFTCANVGENVVTLTVTDEAGNTSTATSIVTVVDNINPTITLLGDASVTHDAFTPYNDAGVTFADNCSSSATLDTDNPVDVNVPGEYTITYTVTDAGGSSVFVTRTVTVVDDVDPVAVSIPTLTVTLDENGQALITGSSLDNGSSDNSGSVSLTVSPSVLTCSDLGENTVTLTVTDAQGNTATATTIVTVTDDETPTISLLGDPSVTHEAFTAYVDAGVSFDDNCTASTTLSTDNPVDVNTPGEYTITYTATDGAGNSVSTSRTVIIEDSTDPVASSIPSLTLSLNDQGQAVVSGSDVDNGSSDASGDISLTVSPSSFDCSNLGVNTVILTVTDASGNTATSTTEVTIEDNIAPVVSLIGDAIITHDAFTAYNDQGVDVVENCSFNVNTTNPVDVDTPGEYTINYVVTDAGGNEVSVSRTVNVVDNVDPEAVALSGFSITLDGQGQASISGSDVDGGSTDNSGSLTLSVSPSSFDCSNIGLNEVTLTVTDASGNSDSVTTEIFVEGEQPSVAINDFTAVPNQNVNTVYIGYGPSSIQLSASVQGASNVTYEWMDEDGVVFSTSSSPQVSPTYSQVYSVKVTSATGCEAFDSIEVCVVDVRVPRKKKKVFICHHTGNGRHKTLSVSRNAVPAHLRHGDSLGSCNATCVTNDDASRNDNEEIVLGLDKEISIYPNPSQGEFKVELNNFEGSTQIILYNFYGRVVQDHVENLTGKTFSLDMGRFNLRQGKYFLRVISGKKSYSKTIIIQKD